MPRRIPPPSLQPGRRGHRRLMRWLPAVAIAAALASPTGVAAATTTIGLDDPSAGTGGALAPPDLAPVASIAPPHSLFATFIEGPPLRRTRDCATEPRICHAVLKGRGSLMGFGAASEITGLTQHREVTPCGPSSDAEVYTRRIRTTNGVLALRASGEKCPTDVGFRVTARYRVDGNSSTGVFAGARGSGIDRVDLLPGHSARVTICGTLRIA